MGRANNLFLLLILRGKNPASLRIRLAASCSWMVFHRLSSFPLRVSWQNYTVTIQNTAVLFSLFSTSLYIPFFYFFPESGRTPGLQQERGSHGLLCVHSLKCHEQHLPPVPPVCAPDLWCPCCLAQAASLHFDFLFWPTVSWLWGPWLPVTSEFRSSFCLFPGLLDCFGSYWCLGS